MSPKQLVKSLLYSFSSSITFFIKLKTVNEATSKTPSGNPHRLRVHWLESFPNVMMTC